MKHSLYIIYPVVLAFLLGVTGCDKSDQLNPGDDLQQIEGITLGLWNTEIATEATTRANVNGVSYAVNTKDDPTFRDNFIQNRSEWLLDFHLFNNNVPTNTKYDPASFERGKYHSASSSWKPDPVRELFYPNYFKPQVEAWLYPSTKDADVEIDQSVLEDFVNQDILSRTKSLLSPIAKKIFIELSHTRAMINFKFENLVRNDIDASTVRVRVGTDEYKPYMVKDNVLEFMLILPVTKPAEAAKTMTVEYSTVGNHIQQPIEYRQTITLPNDNKLERNNCYCFTLSGKELAISPITVINWETGEAVSGEYVAVTAYPTLKGPVNKNYYFYYDNKLMALGAPKLQEINFNLQGECTIKTDGRIITHIFDKENPTEADWTKGKLVNPVILGNTEKMYINLESIINAIGW